MPAYSMSSILMRSRVTVMSTISPLRSFLTWKTTCVPGSPRIFSLHCWELRPTTLSPSMDMISSPHTRPYFEAGEPA